MTFTEEQIREAIGRLIDSPGMENLPDDLDDWVISRLTRTQPEFRDGEVFCSCDEMYAAYNNHGIHDGMRKLRLSEMPEAVEQLRKFVDWVAAQRGLLSRQRADYEVVIDTAIQARADFDREIES